MRGPLEAAPRFPREPPRVLDEMPAQHLVRKVALQVREITQQGVWRLRQVGHAGGVGPHRSQRTAVLGPKGGEDCTGAAGEAPGKRDEQGGVAAEPLHESAWREPGLAGDVGQREFVRPPPAHHPLRCCEHILVGHLLALCGHGS